MQKARWTRAFWLVVVAALILGCGGLTNSPTPTPLPSPTSTQPPPTPTSIPPTETPVPTDTPTPVPTQSLSSMIEALAAVAQGSGVADAAAYEKSKAGIHPIVVLAPEDEVEDWNWELPTSWQPLYVSQTELVALVKYRDVELNKTRYKGSGSGWIYVTRVRIDTVVTLFEARTGATVDTKTFTGVEPVGFPPTLPSGTQYLYGETVPHETVVDWLKPFVSK